LLNHIFIEKRKFRWRFNNCFG